MTRNNPFGTKVLYRLLFIHILHYSAKCCTCNLANYCLLNCSNNLISHFNHADFFGGEKLEWHSSCDID